MNRRHCLAVAGAAALECIAPVFAAVPAAPYDAVLAAYPDFIGTVVVGRGASVLYGKAIGQADPQEGRPMALDTRFETGSVSKWIATMVVLKLVDDGRLALDRPISGYLPGFRADNGARLTLRHLLSHSSGVPNDIAAARKADPQVAYVELEQMEAVRRYASGDLRFAPGSAWDYSHANWLIVKAIVERAAGMAYCDCVSRWLVEPLRLRDSGVFSGASDKVAGMAVAVAGPPWVRKVSAIPGYMAMAGGFYSSAPDVLRLMDGVLGGQLLSPSSRAELLRVVMPDQHYALGGRTRIETIGGKAREAAWEDGSNGGFRLVARRVLEDGVSVVVFNNTSHDYRSLGELASALMETAYI
jgi:CubicO group peptidase (beta-lactamase class C family)